MTDHGPNRPPHDVARRLRLFAGQASARRDQVLAEPAHDVRTAAILGIALGVCFGTCFLTGLFSHLLQHPSPWLDLPTRPAGLYRITQGLHVISGTAAIPLLVAKLWSVYPRLFLPLGRHVTDVVERMSLVPLVGGSLFMLVTGSANVARWYPWGFFFPRGHYWAAWITTGALVAHIGARFTSARTALSSTPTAALVDRNQPAGHADTPGPIDRRTLLVWAGVASAGLTLATAGQTVPLLRHTVLFAPRRPDIGTQGLPINRTAAEAGIEARATTDAWRLVVEADGVDRLTLDLPMLEALPRRAATLPIACVEGWSASARWRGVPVQDLLELAGVTHYSSVDVVSLEPSGLYNRSLLSVDHIGDADTLLALELNGEWLDLDHGYPLRLIAPNRPGVLQTKWVTRLVVR
jgi:DMSO/TMAO reductase YedYZ molybdopterin-dependent catalytic subunit